MFTRRLPMGITLIALALVLSLAGCSLGANASPTSTVGVAPTAAATMTAAAPTAAATSAAAAPVASSRPLAQTGSTGGVAAATPTIPTPATPARTAATPSTGAPMALPDIAAVAAKVRPATVLVLNLAPASAPGGRRRAQATPGPDAGIAPQGAGSGFIYDPAGFIVTNDHVVEGAQQLQVILPPPDNRSFTATLVGHDPQTDLAVLKIDGQNLPTVPLGNSSQLQVGEWVVAIGNALALQGGPTVTAGVVSATGRDEQEPGEQQGTVGPTLYDLIQTDAAINPGNSGGPLVNMRGEVVGINTLGSTQAQGINFSIAIDGAKPIVDRLRQSGQVTRGYLGIGGATVTPALAASLGLTAKAGVVIGQLDPNGPAAQAGLQQGDVIIGLGDVTIQTLQDLQNALTNKYKPGATVDAKIMRGDNAQTITITLGQTPTT